MHQIFGHDQRVGKWYFCAYVDGQQIEWGPYQSEDVALEASTAFERNGRPAQLLRQAALAAVWALGSCLF